MLAWLTDLNAKERRTMGGCFGGWALDAFDVQMYSLVIPTVIAVWGLSRGEAGLIGTVTLLISSLGGWFSGALADRFGRVRMLQITILWYSIFTFLCAFAQNFEQLFALRALHGLGFGGEWAAGAVLMGEVIRDKYRGRAVGLVQTGWAIGWGASALVYTGLYAFLPEAMAWRALFAIGLLPAVFVFWIRRHIDEPEIFRNTQRTRPTIGITHLFSAFRGPHLWTTVKVSLMVAGAQGGGYALGIWMPTWLRTVRGLSATDTGGFLLIQILGALLGFPARDIFERRNRAPVDLSVVSDWVADYGSHLHAPADEQRDPAHPRRAAEHCAADEIPADGPVHDRTLSDRSPRHGPRLLLQCRPGDRLVLPDLGWVLEPGAVTRGDDRGVQRNRLGHHDRHAVPPAGNPRPQLGQPRDSADGHRFGRGSGSGQLRAEEAADAAASRDRAKLPFRV